MSSTLLEPQPPSLARQHYRSAIAARRKTIRVLRLVALLLLIALASAGWYVGKRGFGRQARLRIAEELGRRGVRASVARLTLDPFRGLIAQDVRVFDNTGENTLAVISEIALDLNYAALLHHQPFLNALDVRDARVSIPLPPSGNLATKVRVTNFRAHVYFPPDQIDLSEAEGLFAGVRITASGQLIKRADYQPPPDSEEESRRRLELLQRVVSEIDRCRFPATAPAVQIKFTADLSHPEAAHATATLQADRIERGAYAVRNVSATAEWANQILSVTRCDWSDNAGGFAGRATWDRPRNTGEFQARSTLALPQFLDACGYGKLVEGLSFTTPPVIDLSGSMHLGEGPPSLSLIGRVSAGSLNYRGTAISSLATDFSWDGTRTMLRDLRARFEPGGEISADVLDAPNDFRLNLESTVSPAALRPMAPPEVAKFLAEWEWPRPPRLRLSVRGSSRAPLTWSGEGNVEMDRTRFRSAWMNSLSAHLRFADHAINFDNLHLTREEGVGTGNVAYDFARNEVRLTNVRMNLRPTDVIVWIEPRLYRHVAPYKFRRVPNVTGNGVVQFQGGTADHLELLVDAPAGMDYVFLGKTLPIDRVSGRLLFTHDRLQISDLAGTLFEGAASGTADISLARGDPHYRASLTLDGVDFPRLSDLYFKYKSARGRLAGTFDWTGLGDEARTIDGLGKVRVSEGNVFAIPVFGPLSSLLGAIIPGAGYSVAHQATADFTFKNGIIHTDNFKVAGKLFSMVGHGDIHALEDKLDFDVKISGGGAGALLTPVYNLFQYKGEGSIANPKWHPKNF